MREDGDLASRRKEASLSTDALLARLLRVLSDVQLDGSAPVTADTTLKTVFSVNGVWPEIVIDLLEEWYKVPARQELIDPEQTLAGFTEAYEVAMERIAR